MELIKLLPFLGFCQQVLSVVNYCPKYECDYFVECFLAGQGLTQNASDTILANWNHYRTTTCSTISFQFYANPHPQNPTDLRKGEAGYCTYMLQTAEVQLDFLKGGVPFFPENFFMIRRVNNFDSIKLLSGGCWRINYQLETQATVINNQEENDAITCASNYSAASNHVAFNLTSSNKTHPTDPASYKNPINATLPLTFKNWAPKLSNKSNWACAAVRYPDGKWTNRDCAAPLDVACNYKIILSPIVQLMTDSQVGPADPGSMLAIEDTLRQISVNEPDLVGAGLLELGKVQLEINITDTRNMKIYKTTLQLQFGNLTFTLFLKGKRPKKQEVVTPVMAFPRNASGSLGPPATNGMVTERLVSPGTIGFITVSGWYDGNKSYPGIADLVFKAPEPRGACEDLLFPIGNNTAVSKGELHPVCVFVDRRTKRYNTSGCVTTIDDVTGNVKCACNHLTMFAVLLAVRTVVVAEGVKMVSYGTEAGSIGALVVTIAILSRYRNFIKGDRTSIQINLSVSLLLFHLINLAHDLALKQDHVCVIHTVINHYLLLSTGCWMMVEGIRIFMATSDPVGFKVQDESKRYRAFLALGWGAPALVVIASITVGIPLGLYMHSQSLYKQCNRYINATVTIPKYDRCWLAPGSPIFYSSVVGPLCIILLLNFMIAMKTSLVMLNSKRMQNRNQGHSLKDISRASKSLMFLFLTLGATWCIGFFTGIGNEITSLIFLYANAVINGAQGIVVFILYCITNDVIREKLFPPKKNQKKKPQGGVDAKPKSLGKSDVSGSKGVCRIREPGSSTTEGFVSDTQITKDGR